MYTREKQLRSEIIKAKKSHRNSPSFSSTLLDEICRSIDDKPEPKTPATARLSRVEKWMESEKTVFRRRMRSENAVFPENDPLAFTSTSTSSDSSTGLSSSDADLFSSRPKPVRTRGGGGGGDRNREKDCYLFDEYEEHERRNSGGGNEDRIKSKSPAMKIYSNLKKMKHHPVSPGARLSSFFNSLFSGLNRKKPRDSDKKPAAPSPAKMLARCSTKSTNRTSVSIERAVRVVDLTRAVADRDIAMPRAKMASMGDGRPPLPPTAISNPKKFDFDRARYKRDEEEEDDDVSESSSDLFELDYLSLNKDRFCEELPVYETTYFDKNRRLFR